MSQTQTLGLGQGREVTIKVQPADELGVAPWYGTRFAMTFDWAPAVGEIEQAPPQVQERFRQVYREMLGRLAVHSGNPAERILVLDRAGDRCEVCRAPANSYRDNDTDQIVMNQREALRLRHELGHDVVQTELDIAHVDRRFQNVDLSNLLALCPHCMAEHHRGALAYPPTKEMHA